MAPQSGASSLPRCFRYDRFQTPEPTTAMDTPEPMESVEAPSPHPRLRIRRAASVSLGPPTDQFLASVAAADLPIPSIEEPELIDDDLLLHDTTYPVSHTIGDLCGVGVAGRARISPPKTPAPGNVPSATTRRYPNWSADAVSSSESSPECDSRPSTSRSTQTTASAFSSRFSLASEEPRCASPRVEPFPSLSQENSLPVNNNNNHNNSIHAPPYSAPAKPRRAVWTRAMTDHLWATYNLYMQDPRVTPFQVGATGVPPLGVCVRVAREAKRSWKGLRLPLHGGMAPSSQWPHTCAATRTWLRELCKRKAGTSQTRGLLAMASTPAAAPGQIPTRHRARRAVPRSPSAFGNVDMAVSLALSTAESMQPNGPLAQLAQSSPTMAPLPSSSSPSPPLPTFSFPAAPPFIGPHEQHDHHHDHQQQQQHHHHEQHHDQSIGLGWLEQPPRLPKRGLQSPVKISHSRSKSAVHKAAPQKMRSRAATNDARRCRRPSMSDMVSAEMLAQMPTLAPVTPVPPLPTEIQQPPQIMEPAHAPRHYDDSDVPRTPMHRNLFRPRALTTMNEMSPVGVNANLAVAGADAHPLRLGSPFMANPAFSFDDVRGRERAGHRRLWSDSPY